MQKDLKRQRALRYRELARDVIDDAARDQILHLASEYDDQAHAPSSPNRPRIAE